jgi:hypothetical protein
MSDEGDQRNELSLLDAFRTLSRSGYGEHLDAECQAAAARMHLELQRIARMMFGTRHDREDAASEVLLRLLSAGFRRVRERDPGPQTDNRVRAYLWKAMRHRLIESLQTGEELPSDWPDPEEEGLRRLRGELRRAVDRARRLLVDEIIPTAVARQRRSGEEAFRRTIDQLRSLADNRTTMDDVISAEFETDAPARLSPDWMKARNRVYQRCHRALNALYEEAVVTWIRQGLSDIDVHALQIVVQEELRGRI